MAFSFQSYSRSGSFGSTNSFDIANRRQESLGSADANSLPSIPPKDREMYIDALRQLEAADDCIDRRAAAAGFLCKHCEFKLDGRNVILQFTLAKNAASIDESSSKGKINVLDVLHGTMWTRGL